MVEQIDTAVHPEPAQEQAATPTTSQIYVFGSGECDQLGLEFGEDDVMEIKRAKKIEMFNCDPEADAPLSSKVAVAKIMCGGMHSVALTPQG